MIVSSIQGVAQAVDERLGETQWRCLARRGMLYSECEAFDYLRLAPGAGRDTRGREGIEEAWFVLSGEGEFSDSRGNSFPMRAGDLIVCPRGTGGWLRNSAVSSLELLVIAVMPAAVTARLPVRTPVAQG
ncbi:MAG: cupin domain-containing protein [Egibacteraceae bacterium]